MVPSIAQLVERRTVEYMIVILRSLVRIRLEGNFFLIELFFFSFLFFFSTSVNICFLFSFEIFISYFYMLKSLLSLPEINVLSPQRHHMYMN